MKGIAEQGFPKIKFKKDQFCENFNFCRLWLINSGDRFRSSMCQQEKFPSWPRKIWGTFIPGMILSGRWRSGLKVSVRLGIRNKLHILITNFLLYSLPFAVAVTWEDGKLYVKNVLRMLFPTFRNLLEIVKQGLPEGHFLLCFMAV